MRRIATLGLLVSLLFIAFQTDSAAQARRGMDNPVDAEQLRLASVLKAKGKKPEGIVPLLELWQNARRASPEVTPKLIRQIAKDKRMAPAVQGYAQALEALLLVREGEVDEGAARFDEIGYLRRFRVVGPFDNEGKQGLSRVFPPERQQDAPSDLNAEFEGRERPVRFRSYPDITRTGFVDFDAIYKPDENVCALAETFVELKKAQPLTLWFGTGGAGKVYFNGEQVLEDSTYRNPDWDRQSAVVAGREGANRILVKSCVESERWGFYLRVADARGRAMGTINHGPELADVQASAARTPSLPKVPMAALAALEAAAEKRTTDAGAAYALARFIHLTAADNAEEQLALKFVKRAIDAGGDAEAIVFAADLSEERAEQLRYLQLAKAKDPKHPRTQLLDAIMAASGPAPERALRMVEAIDKPGQFAFDVAEFRANLLDQIGLDETAHRVLVDAATRMNGSEESLDALMDAFRQRGHAAKVFELREKLLKLRWDRFDLHSAMVTDALERKELDRVEKHVQVFQDIAPGNVRAYYYAADILEGLKRYDDALAQYRAALALRPEDADAHVTYGRALLRLGHNDAASESFKHALALRPQDAHTRQLLEQIRPEQRPDEAHATETAKILERRGKRASGWPATVLHDLRVNSVYDNGLGSQFRQLAIEVHDEEGARRHQTVPIAYEPGSQMVDVRLARVHRKNGDVLESYRTFEQQLGQPEYRIYYDQRALVIRLPDLEPGDVLEVRYRIDDVAHRNVFADYYGDLQFFKGGEPVRRLEYVLVTPKARRLYFNEPNLRGLESRVEEKDGKKFYFYTADNVPALRSESQMPGMTEVAPYLHVSTYENWEGVGRWWWGLIEEQLHLDDRLRETVADLVKGAPDTRTKVRRIYAWVIKNTRYVGLEFGIHGYKPYRVTQVVRRGFGDCKDKASLLYAMMTEAGIDARIVLVRTRRNGAIPELPASLRVFDHAIAYVPELDLFLDGTAEYSGSEELPSMDQGVTVLVVGPKDVALRKTPVFAPEHALRSRELTIALETDGTAEVTAREEVHGSSAGSYRNTYEAEGTRKERLQRQLRQTFPGIEVQSQNFDAMDDFDVPVRFGYKARVPQLAKRNGGGLRLAPSTLEGLLEGYARQPSRKHPLELVTTSLYRERRRVRLGALTVAELPEGGAVESPFGRASVTYERRGAELVIATEFEIRKDRIPPEEYGAFRAWIQSADALFRARVVLEEGR